MAATVTHTTHSGAGSGAGGTISSSEWDATHTISGLYNRYPALILVGGSSVLTTIGLASSSAGVTTTGTLSAFGGSNVGSQTRFATAATANSQASATANVSAYIPPLNSLRSPGVSATATLDFFDASYGSGSTGTRTLFGIGRVLANMISADNGDAASNNSQGIWFSYSSNRGANWFLVMYSSTGSATTVDTGVAFTPGVWSFTLDFLESAASFNWTIRNIGGSSASGTVTNAANPFPVNKSTPYVIAAGLVTLTTTARNFGILRMGFDLLEPV